MFGLSRIGEVSGGQFSENGKVRRAIKTILEVRIGLSMARRRHPLRIDSRLGHRTLDIFFGVNVAFTLTRELPVKGERQPAADEATASVTTLTAGPGQGAQLFCQLPEINRLAH
jgi:hypothetical protein